MDLDSDPVSSFWGSAILLALFRSRGYLREAQASRPVTSSTSPPPRASLCVVRMLHRSGCDHLFRESTSYTSIGIISNPLDCLHGYMRAASRIE